MTSIIKDIQIITGSWSETQEYAKPIRYAVFVDEQGVPEQLEMDDKDVNCIHVVVMHADGFPVATARMDDSGKIGRMAVLPDWRRQKLGQTLLDTLFQHAREMDLQLVYCHAQQQVSAFYEEAGFNAVAAPFDEAGIRHVKMVKEL